MSWRWFGVFCAVDVSLLLACSFAPRSDDVASVKPNSASVTGDANEVSESIAVASPQAYVGEVADGASAEVSALRNEVEAAMSAVAKLKSRDVSGVKIVGTPISTLALAVALGAVSVLAVVFLFLRPPGQKKCRPP